MLAALYLLCMALGGAIGDPLNGGLFDLVDGYRPLFVHMSVYARSRSPPTWRSRAGAGEAGSATDLEATR